MNWFSHHTLSKMTSCLIRNMLHCIFQELVKFLSLHLRAMLFAPSFEFAKSFFNGIQVWWVWRQISEFNSSFFTNPCKALLLAECRDNLSTSSRWILQLSIIRTEFLPGYGVVWGMTWSSTNATNKSLLKLPWRISQSTNPSHVYNGRTVHFLVRVRGWIWRALVPTGDHPNLRSRVLSLKALSSMNMSCSQFHSDSCINQSCRSSSERSLAILWS